MQDVPRDNIINYDETMLVDDPGVVAVIVRRSAKNANEVNDTTRTGPSVMFSGNFTSLLTLQLVV